MSSTPGNYHDIPEPDATAAGRNNRDAHGDLSMGKQARLYSPLGAPPSEQPVSTLARFAGRLIDRISGKAYSADELAGNIITPESIGAATPELVATAIDAAELTPAQVMSKAGDQLIASLRAVRGTNAGTAYFATTRSTSGTFTIRTSTGYARLVNPDNTLGAQVGTGNANSNLILGIPASGLHRAYGFISVVNGGTVRGGDITLLILQERQLTSFSGTGLSALTSLNLFNNQLTSFSGTGLSALTSLNLNNNQLTTFSGAGLSSLITLDLSNNQLTTFSGAGLSSLTALYINNNQLTTFSGTGLSYLAILFLIGNQLTTFSATGLLSLYRVYLDSNQLTSIDMSGAVLDYFHHFFGGSSIEANLLDGPALDAFYTSLGIDLSGNGIISVIGNPGTSTDDPTIATAKGYAIVGT